MTNWHVINVTWESSEDIKSNKILEVRKHFTCDLLGQKCYFFNCIPIETETCIETCNVGFVLFVLHGRPRQATDVLQSAGLLYRQLWTFQLWPPDSPAPTDAFRTLAAKVGTYGRGIGLVILPKCRLPRYILGTFYMPQICDMGPTALLPFRRKAYWGFFRP
jgi:hypothetical protein